MEPVRLNLTADKLKTLVLSKLQLDSSVADIITNALLKSEHTSAFVDVVLFGIERQTLDLSKRTFIKYDRTDYRLNDAGERVSIKIPFVEILSVESAYGGDKPTYRFGYETVSYGKPSFETFVGTLPENLVYVDMANVEFRNDFESYEALYEKHKERNTGRSY